MTFPTGRIGASTPHSIFSGTWTPPLATGKPQSRVWGAERLLDCLTADWTGTSGGSTCGMKHEAQRCRPEPVVPPCRTLNGAYVEAMDRCKRSRSAFEYEGYKGSSDCFPVMLARRSLSCPFVVVTGSAML